MVVTVTNTKLSQLREQVEEQSPAAISVAERTRQLNCLTKNIYWEAGSEPFEVVTSRPANPNAAHAASMCRSLVKTLATMFPSVQERCAASTARTKTSAAPSHSAAGNPRPGPSVRRDTRDQEPATRNHPARQRGPISRCSYATRTLLFVQTNAWTSSCAPAPLLRQRSLMFPGRRISPLF